MEKQNGFKVIKKKGINKNGNQYEMLILSYVDELGEIEIGRIFLNSAQSRVLNKVPYAE